MISEKKLEKLLLKDISEGNLSKKIKRLDDETSAAGDSFFNRIIAKRYRENVDTILETFKGDITPINVEDGSIRSISMDPQKLLPDILALSVETNDYLIFELKVKKQTEREAVTELYAYETELINHVPLIERSSIHKIIVSTEFGSSLKHAVSDMILHGDSVICLEPVIEDSKITGYLIVDAYEWTVVNYELPLDLSKGIFNGVGLCFYKSTNYKKSISEKKVIQDMHLAVDLLRDIDNRAGGNGFSLIWKRENKSGSRIEDTLTDYFVYSFAINPYLVYLREVYSREDCLSKFICKHISDSDKLEDGAQEYKKSWERVKALLSDKYAIQWESPMNLYQNLMHFKEATIVGIDSWGELGQELKEAYWNDRILRSCGVTLDDPDAFLKLISFLYDEYPFKRENGLGEIFHLAMYIGAIEEIGEMFLSDFSEDADYRKECYQNNDELVTDSKWDEYQDKIYDNSCLNEIRNLWKIVFCSIEKISPQILRPAVVQVRRSSIPKIIGVIRSLKQYLYKLDSNNKNIMDLAEKYGSFSWELRDYKLFKNCDFEMFNLDDDSFDTDECIAPRSLREVFDFCLALIIEKCRDNEDVRKASQDMMWNLIAQYNKEKKHPGYSEGEIIQLMKSGEISIESETILATDMIGYMRDLLNIYGRFSDGAVIPIREHNL